MSVHAELPFERFRYWQGQRVRARDFTDQLAEVDRQTRWHNRAVHQAFGVRSGFAVTSVEATLPHVRVRVECGVAFDRSGAVLALQRARELTIDIDDGTSAVLLVRSRAAGGSGCSCHGAAGSTGSGRLWEDDLVLTWASGRVLSGDAGVPLARVSASAGAVTVDQSIRPLVRPVARPRLATGSTIPGLTPWEPWFGGVQTRIDTSAAGFTRVPAYFASCVTTRRAVTLLELRALSLTHVDNAALTEFTFRISSPVSFSRRSRGFTMTELARDVGLVVCWMGCQQVETLPAVCPGQRPVKEFVCP
jgi:hypothetical protein